MIAVVCVSIVLLIQYFINQEPMELMKVDWSAECNLLKLDSARLVIFDTYFHFAISPPIPSNQDILWNSLGQFDSEFLAEVAKCWFG